MVNRAKKSGIYWVYVQYEACLYQVRSKFLSCWTELLWIRECDSFMCPCDTVQRIYRMSYANRPPAWVHAYQATHDNQSHTWILCNANSSLSIFCLSDYTQNNWRRGSGETMDIPNDILLFPRSLVSNCFVHDHSTKISELSYSLQSNR